MSVMAKRMDLGRSGDGRARMTDLSSSGTGCAIFGFVERVVRNL